MISIDKITKYSLEIIIFILITVFIFNELSQILQTLGLFNDKVIKDIGIISAILAVDNVLSKSFLGLKLFN